MTTTETPRPAPSSAERTRLVVHIGDPKTGSTSIQRALFDHTWSATGHSIAYPDMLNALPLARALNKDAPSERATEFGKAAGWLARQSTEVAVISSEHFAPVPPAVMHAAIQEFFPDYAASAQVIAYVRPHISRLLSSYTQRVKARGLQQDFDGFCRHAVEKQRFHYTPRFLAWQEEFGTSFILRPMMRSSLYRGDVVADFLHQALGSEDFTLDGTVEANVAPTLDHLACLRQVHAAIQEAGIGDELRFTCGKYLADRLASIHPDGPRLRLPRALLAELQPAYAEDAAQLDDIFFEGTPMSEALKAAEDGATDDPQSLDADQRFSQPQLRQMKRLSTSLAAELAKTPARWKQLFREAMTQSAHSNRNDEARVYELMDEIGALLT